MCGILAKLRHCVGYDILKMVYHALVASHLQYCNLIWGNANETILKPLQTLQNCLVRIMTFAPFGRIDMNPILNYLEILDIDDIFLLETAKLIYKIKNISTISSNAKNL